MSISRRVKAFFLVTAAAAATASQAFAQPLAGPAPVAAPQAKPADGPIPAGPAREGPRHGLPGNGVAEDLLVRDLAAVARTDLARWQSGFVREGGAWTRYDAVAEAEAYRRSLDRYQAERRSHADTLKGHVAMAEWCRDEKLPMQERAHWFKVLQFDADHPNARMRLGYVQVGPNWVTRQEIESTRLRESAAQQAYKKWSTVLRPIRIAFESEDPARTASAREKLAGLRDPAAIPALEAVLSPLNIEAATAVVAALRKMKGPEATVGLARQAVFAEWYPTGREAAEALRDCDELGYVPLMLSALAVPPGDNLRISMRPGDHPGKLLVRYEFERERQDRTEKTTHDVSYGVWVPSYTAAGLLPPELAHANDRPRTVISVPVAPGTRLPPGSLQWPGVTREGYYRSIVQARAEADRAKVDALVAAESRLTNDLNGRICRALRTATGLPEGEMTTDDPRAWWDWWTRRSEVFVRGAKPIEHTKVVSTVNEVVPRHIAPPTLVAVDPTRRGSCLVAGTTVYTDVGPRPVEQIRLGDRVLAQNVDTGELSYRAVLEPTVRPAAPTVVLRFGDKQIQATGGHPFWASGRGWTKAREFEPGMRMASVGGTVEITGIEPAGDAPAYNLVVDEFHTYFVGDTLVLSHDNTPPAAPYRGMPGEARP
jgi:hypothetical protein